MFAAFITPRHDLLRTAGNTLTWRHGWQKRASYDSLCFHIHIWTDGRLGAAMYETSPAAPTLRTGPYSGPWGKTGYAGAAFLFRV